MTTKRRGQAVRQSAQAVYRVLLKSLARVESASEAHALAQWVASFLVGNSCGVYRSDELEELMLSACAFDRHVLREQVTKKLGVLHVLSEPYPHGGHTRVVRHLLAHADGIHHILLTRPIQAPQAHQWLGVAPDCVHQYADSVSMVERVAKLAVDIAGHAEVMLYLHPEDVVGGAAVRLARSLNPDIRIGFFDHADHAFSVGIGSADCVFEISTYGWQLRIARGAEACASFVGIPIQASLLPTLSAGEEAERPRALLAGTAYKFKPVGDRMLFDALDALLSSNLCLTVDCVGPDGTEPWWQPLRTKFDDRIRFHGLIAHDRYKALLDSAALFVDSFPKTGGTAFPEALLAGGRVIGLYGGTWGFSVADALRVDGVAGFVEGCAAILRQDPQTLARMQSIRKECAAYHAPVAVWRRITEGLRAQALHPPPAALAAMPAPPILAEEEWLANGELTMRLPDRNSPHARALHRILWRAHVDVFGALHPGSLRWAVTWWSRYALRSK